MNIDVQVLCGHMFSFFLDIYPVKCLDLEATLCLTAKLFSRVAVPKWLHHFTFFPAVCQFLHLFTITCCYLFFRNMIFFKIRELFYNVVLVSAIQQRKSVLSIIYPLPLELPSHPTIPTLYHSHRALSWTPCIVAILVGLKWYLIVVLHFPNNTRHIFMCSLAICMFSLKKCFIQTLCQFF